MSITVERGSGRPKGYYVGTERVPSVTHVTRFKDAGGLLYWANTSGLNGMTLEEARADATGIGTQVHAMVEAYLNESDVPVPLTLEAVGSFQAWKAWWLGAQFEVVATELPLVSEQLMFGGCPDVIARDREGRYCILDWKTSNALYPEHLMQVAAYGLLWDENNPERKITGGFHIIRFSKEHGDMEHRHFADLADALEAFLTLRRFHDFDKDLKRRAK